MLIKLILFVLTVSPLLMAQPPSIDSNGYVGCFINVRSAHEFNAFASHLDETQLTPSLCTKACLAMSYSMAAIEEGTKCFCKSTTSIFYARDLDSACQVLSCAGSASLACGSPNNIMVYNSTSIAPLKVFT